MRGVHKKHSSIILKVVCMCSNCYEKYVEKTERIMLFCRLKDKDGYDEMLKLCTCQRYCNEQDKYIPYKQREGCKYFE